MPIPAWHEAITGFDVLAVALIVGAIAARLAWLPGAYDGSRLQPLLLRRLNVLFAAVLGLLTLTSIAMLFARSVAISGEPFPQVAGVVPLVLQKTDFGRVWLARAAAVLLMWLLWMSMAMRRRRQACLLAILVGVVAFSRSATGHAGDHGDFAWPVWVDWLHLISAGLWGGAIVTFVLAARPVLRQHSQQDDLAAAIVKRYSMLAAAGLALAAATGIYNAWQRVGGWQPLLTTRYGLILDAKLVLVTAMAILGATNRFRHVPEVLAAARSGNPRSLLRALRGLSLTSIAEAVLWLAIIVAVALLLSGVPPSSLPAASAVVPR
ncbi:MAG TPA: CopD family protein [Rhodanobacteraceae bacterium]|nr:CopD family protein [Rhodanobacteraceae bacterium]